MHAPRQNMFQQGRQDPGTPMWTPGTPSHHDPTATPNPYNDPGTPSTPRLNHFDPNTPGTPMHQDWDTGTPATPGGYPVSRFSTKKLALEIIPEACTLERLISFLTGVPKPSAPDP